MILLLEGFAIGAFSAFPAGYIIGMKRMRNVFERVANQYKK